MIVVKMYANFPKEFANITIMCASFYNYLQRDTKQNDLVSHLERVYCRISTKDTIAPMYMYLFVK